MNYTTKNLKAIETKNCDIVQIHINIMIIITFKWCIQIFEYNRYYEI